MLPIESRIHVALGAGMGIKLDASEVLALAEVITRLRRIAKGDLRTLGHEDAKAALAALGCSQ